MRIHISYENDEDKFKILKALLPIIKKEYGKATIRDKKAKEDGKKHYYITIKQ